MVDKAKIELSLVLPSVPDLQDDCIQRLITLLDTRDGVEAVHLANGIRPGDGQVCIHFDPNRITLKEVRVLATRAGGELDKRYGHVLIHSESMHARRARTVEERVRQIDGVLEAAVSPAGTLRIEFDRMVVDEDLLRKLLKSTGVEEMGDRKKRKTSQAVEVKAESSKKGNGHEHGGPFGEKLELGFSLACGGLLLTGWLLSIFTAVVTWVPWAFYIGAYFFGGFFTIREAVQNVRVRRFEIDSLMLVAAIGAASLGEWAEGALLLFLFSLGHAMEHYAMGRAKKAIEALADLAPQTAIVRREGGSEEISVDQLVVGDVVVVKPNEKIPADGFVIKGESSVNQAPITGESVPVDKLPVDEPERASQNPEQLDSRHLVFTGTINESGALEIQVTKVSSESTLARVVEMVSEAETQKSPTQLFTDRFERYFVPAVLSFAVILLFAWVVVDESFSDSFYRAMAVLVAASPCALAISTPSAVLSGIARAARSGVLVKGGGPLERLGALGAIAFDKTGTLTEGKPRLIDVVGHDGITERELLRIAVAVEELSDHPLAAAVVRDGRERLSGELVAQASNLQSITGRGVKAVIEGQTVYIGKDDLFEEIGGAQLPEAVRKQVESLEAEGRTTMIVRRSETYLGVLGLMDTPREVAKQVIASLRELGVRRMIMISGDNQQVADAVANEVGIDEAWGDLMPDDKVDSIKKLREKEDVAMVGDGVNDAPAMANATVGIAMGAAGSDVALETADVALMADDLKHLPFAVGLSRKTSQVIRQNLFVSLGMVIILVPATVFGLQMGVAVMLHEGSTLLVVFNALRLLGYARTDSGER